MAFSSWRGCAGLVMPTMRPGVIEELIRMLPEGISVLPLYNNIRGGTREEFAAVMHGYEEKLGELAAAGVDVLHPSGGPPFMVLGYEHERDLIRRWERQFKLPVFTTGMNDCDALTALGAKRFVGISYFPEELNQSYAQYFRDAGFACLGIEAIGIPFEQMQELASTEIYRFARRMFLAHRGAQGIYLLGAWRANSVIELMERDFGVPVVASIPAQSWGLQKRLHVRQPIAGLGRLLAELP